MTTPALAALRAGLPRRPYHAARLALPARAGAALADGGRRDRFDAPWMKPDAAGRSQRRPSR